MFLGFGLAVGVYEVTRGVPNAFTIALIVALAIAVEQWRLLREQASWVSFAAVLMITIGTDDPAAYVLRYGGLTLLGAVVGVAVTTLLFPPMMLTVAVERIGAARALLAAHLLDMADAVRGGTVPDPEDWAHRGRALSGALDRMRAAETQVERARRANPRAARWQGAAAGCASSPARSTASPCSSTTSPTWSPSSSRTGAAWTGWTTARAGCWPTR